MNNNGGDRSWECRRVIYQGLNCPRVQQQQQGWQWALVNSVARSAYSGSNQRAHTAVSNLFSFSVPQLTRLYAAAVAAASSLAGFLDAFIAPLFVPGSNKRLFFSFFFAQRTLAPFCTITSNRITRNRFFLRADHVPAPGPKDFFLWLAPQYSYW